MRGHIVARGPNTWRLMVYVGRDPATGREVRSTRTVKGTRRDAEIQLGKLIGEVGEGRVATAPGTTGELLERWYAAAQPGWSPKTANNVRKWLDGYLIPELGAIKLRRLRGQDIEQMYGRMRRAGLSGRPLAEASIERIHTSLRRALSTAVDSGLIVGNPADQLSSRPKGAGSEIDPPTVEQVNHLLEVTADDPPLCAFLHVAVGSGARRGELLALRWSSINLATGALTVRSSMSGRDEKSTKTKKSRSFIITGAALDQLRVLHDQAKADAELGKFKLTPKAYIFADPPWLLPWHPDSVTHWFSDAADRAGIGDVRLHDLRHFHATQMLAAGVDVKTVASRLGHSPTMTLTVYGHFVPAADRAAAEAFERAMRG